MPLSQQAACTQLYRHDGHAGKKLRKVKKSLAFYQSVFHKLRFLSRPPVQAG